MRKEELEKLLHKITQTDDDVQKARMLDELGRKISEMTRNEIFSKDSALARDLRESEELKRLAKEVAKSRRLAKELAKQRDSNTEISTNTAIHETRLLSGMPKCAWCGHDSAKMYSVTDGVVLECGKCSTIVWGETENSARRDWESLSREGVKRTRTFKIEAELTVHTRDFPPTAKMDERNIRSLIYLEDADGNPIPVPSMYLDVLGLMRSVGKVKIKKAEEKKKRFGGLRDE